MTDENKWKIAALGLLAIVVVPVGIYFVLQLPWPGTVGEDAELLVQETIRHNLGKQLAFPDNLKFNPLRDPNEAARHGLYGNWGDKSEVTVGGWVEYHDEGTNSPWRGRHPYLAKLRWDAPNDTFHMVELSIDCQPVRFIKSAAQ